MDDNESVFKSENSSQNQNFASLSTANLLDDCKNANINEETHTNGSSSPLLQTQDAQYAYKSGAKYQGQISDNVRYGRGKFVWPNGDKYEGGYKMNLRNGFGIKIL